MADTPKNGRWLDSYFATHSELKNEERYVKATCELLTVLGCDEVHREYEIPSGRVDVAGILPNGHWVMVECKDFEINASAHVDALMQAASYADSIKYPIFIGPFNGSRSTLCNGNADDGMTMLHLIAGRLNVGFLAVNDRGGVQLILRGQVLASSRDGLHTQFANHWGYVQRFGSKQVKK
jgi:hypothetical protein